MDVSLFGSTSFNVLITSRRTEGLVRGPEGSCE
jgi:hypothetical protein